MTTVVKVAGLAISIVSLLLALIVSAIEADTFARHGDIALALEHAFAAAVFIVVMFAIVVVADRG